MPRYRILVVDADPDTLDVLLNQTLGPAGFDAVAARDGPSALERVAAFKPDMLMVSLKLGDFSGKDLLTGLQTRGFEGPIVALVSKEDLLDALQAFRLGAADYLIKPLREAEVIAAVDRVMRSVRAQRERERLQQRLQEANQELEQRVRELTTLFGIGKAVTNLTDVDALFAKLVEAATYVTGSEMGWLLLADEESGRLILRAAKNLPRAIAKNLRQPWDSGLAPLVMMSGEPLRVAGEGMARFPIAQLARAALVVPVKVRDQPVGVLVAANKAARPFSERNEAMLKAVADYASIAVVNVRLFRALEARARSLQQAYEELAEGESVKDGFLQNVSHELRTPISQAQWQLKSLLADAEGQLSNSQREALTDADQKLQRVAQIIEDMVTVSGDGWAGMNPETLLLADIAREAMAAHQDEAQSEGVALIAGFPERPLHVVADRNGLRIVFDKLLSNAIKFSSDKAGEVYVRIADVGDGSVRVQVQDTGIGIPADKIGRIFDRFVQLDNSTTRRHGGTGLGLTLTKEIVEAHGGQIWAESKPGKGTSFYFTLLRSDQDTM